jgi:hypothetical protein
MITEFWVNVGGPQPYHDSLRTRYSATTLWAERSFTY